MIQNRKKILAYMLAASMVSAAAAGCQKSGTSLAQARESEESSMVEMDKHGDVGETKKEEDMNRQNSGKGKTRKAQEPERVNISPEDYESWDKLLQENKVSYEFQRALDQFAYKSGSVVLKEAQGNGNYSPLSLYYTLALAGCGSAGETAAQILENLGVKSQEDLAGQCRSLYQRYVYQTQREQELMEHYGR